MRQRPILNYIVDFFAPELKLIIEIDGTSHLTKGDYDFKREQELIQLGYTFLRFTEGNVLNDLNSVVIQIEHAIYCLKQELGEA